jgi:hypothetical protein
MGQVGEKDAAWSNPANQIAVRHLCQSGYIVTGNVPYADGHVDEVPLRMSRLEVQEARTLLENKGAI